MSMNEGNSAYQHVRDAYEGVGLRETPEDNPLDDYRYPDADEASQYFGFAEQTFDTVVEVEAHGYTATIRGEDGYRWFVKLRIPDSRQAFAPDLLTVPHGRVVDVDGEDVIVRLVGMCEHVRIYRIVHDLLEQFDEMDIPKHHQDALAVESYLHERKQRLQEDDSE